MNFAESFPDVDERLFDLINEMMSLDRRVETAVELLEHPYLRELHEMGPLVDGPGDMSEFFHVRITATVDGHKSNTHWDGTQSPPGAMCQACFVVGSTAPEAGRSMPMLQSAPHNCLPGDAVCAGGNTELCKFVALAQSAMAMIQGNGHAARRLLRKEAENDT